MLDYKFITLSKVFNIQKGNNMYSIKKIFAREFLILVLCIILALISLGISYIYFYYPNWKVQNNIEKKISDNKLLISNLSKEYLLKEKNRIDLYNKFKLTFVDSISKPELWIAFDRKRSEISWDYYIQSNDIEKKLNESNPKDHLKTLYNNLIKDNYDLPSFDVFKSDMKIEKNIYTLYNNLLKDNYKLPYFEMFKFELGYSNKKKFTFDNKPTSIKHVLDYYKEFGFNSSNKLKDYLLNNGYQSNEITNYFKSQQLTNDNKALNFKLQDIKNSNKVILRKSMGFSKESFCILLAFLFGIRFFYFSIKWSITTLKNNSK